MRRITKIGLVSAAVLAGCGSGGGGTQSVAAFCKTVRAPNAKINAAGAQLDPQAPAQVLKQAADTLVTQTESVLDDVPPTDIRPAIQRTHETFVKLRDELAANNYRVFDSQGAPPALQDPSFGKAASDLDAYLAQHCGILAPDRGSPQQPGP
ncbi:MAG: hypothetical protein M3256_24595 [Actinomycetota bacterium]|nr:hypothetical protein [Actinomycetota bacterium]